TSTSVINLSLDLPALSYTNILLRFAPASPGSFSNIVVFSSNGGSATNNLQGQAVIAPRIHVTFGGSVNSVILSFDSMHGKDYTIQYKDSLNDPQWQMPQ